MKMKGTIFGFSFTTLMGLIVGIVIVFGLFGIAWSATKSLLPSGDEKELENTLDSLQSSINDLKEGEKQEFLFNLIDREIYLMAFNENSDIEECFRISCLALCFDDLCNNVIIYKKVNDNLDFETTGEIAVLKNDEDKHLLLTIENNQNNISVTSAQQN